MNPVIKITFIITCFVFVTIISLDLFVIFGGIKESKTSVLLENILVESHGLLFDIILFGLILRIYELHCEKKEQIQRYAEEISDFSGWNEKEATYRIIGNIRRLNRLGITTIDLKKTYLEGGDLTDLNLEGSNLTDANLKGASLSKVNLKNANLTRTMLSEASICYADLRGVVINQKSATSIMKNLLAPTKGKLDCDFLTDKNNYSQMPAVDGIRDWDSAKLDNGMLQYIRSNNLD